MAKSIAERYERFAQVEAAGRSPLYERLALHVAGSASALRFLARLPESRQQPNLLFGAIRLVAGTPVSTTDFDAALADHGEAIAQTMLSRTTQTNEPARCASLLPALSRIDGPLALIEVGASAGLCLLPDCYGYDWGRLQLPAPACGGEAGPVFRSEASQETPLPTRHPEIVWRAGLDLNPLGVLDDADMAWLECLVWPEHHERLANLRAAVAVARRSPPRIVSGDLTRDLAALIAEAPVDATLVVFHTAVLSYIADQAVRDAFAKDMLASRAIWLSNESPRVFPQFSSAEPPGKGLFLLARNGEPLAWTGPHGQSVAWIGNPE